MRKVFAALLLIITTSITLFAQQEAQFSQNMFNIMAINPGYAGANDAICATALARQQWSGFKDPDGEATAPQTFLLSIDAPIRLIHGGLGLTISQDELGFEKNLGVKLAYAYHINVGIGRLQVGIQGSFLDKTIDVNKFKPIDPGDQVLLNWQSNITTDFGFGMYYFIKEKLYAGFSTSQLSEATVENTNNPSTFALARHYYIQGGYQWALPSNPSFQFLPSILIKTDFSSAQYDINSLLLYNNRFWGGLSYRVQDAVVVLLGMNWKNFKFGYSYDLTTSAIGSEGRSSGSHEIMLRYCFTIKIPVFETEYHNSRFFDDVKK